MQHRAEGLHGNGAQAAEGGLELGVQGLENRANHLPHPADDLADIVENRCDFRAFFRDLAAKRCKNLLPAAKGGHHRAADKFYDRPQGVVDHLHAAYQRAGGICHCAQAAGEGVGQRRQQLFGAPGDKGRQAGLPQPTKGLAQFFQQRLGAGPQILHRRLQRQQVDLPQRLQKLQDFLGGLLHFCGQTGRGAGSWRLPAAAAAV